MALTKQAKVYMSSYVPPGTKDAVVAEARRRGIAQSEVVEELVEAARRGVVADWQVRDLMDATAGGATDQAAA